MTDAPVKNLAAILDPTAPDDRPLIIQLSPDADEQLRISYGEGRRRIAALARGLLKRGLQRGEAVAIVAANSADYLLLYEYRISDKMAHMTLELIRGPMEGVRTVRSGGPYVHVLELRLVDAETYLDNRYHDSLVWEGGAVVGDVPTMSSKFHDMLVVAGIDQIGASNVEGGSTRMSLNDSEARRLRQ